MRPRGARGPPPLEDDPLKCEQPPRTLAPENTPKGRLSQDEATALPRERLAYLARKIHALGDRPLLVLELERGAPLIERLGRYAALDGDFTRALNGDRLPSTKIVSGRRA
jgi:hypothetical protein